MSDVSLWIDTNVAWSPPKVKALAKLAQRKGVRVVVHAQVHLEIWRQRLLKDKESFSPDLMGTFLQQWGIEVFDVVQSQAIAESWAERLARRYPEREAWAAAKLASVKARLPEGTTFENRRKVPMTTDWLIALAVEDHGGFIAVEDKGEEWTALRNSTPQRAFTYEESLDWLGALPDLPGTSAGASDE